MGPPVCITYHGNAAHTHTLLNRAEFHTHVQCKFSRVIKWECPLRDCANPPESPNQLSQLVVECHMENVIFVVSKANRARIILQR